MIPGWWPSCPSGHDVSLLNTTKASDYSPGHKIQSLMLLTRDGHEKEYEEKATMTWVDSHFVKLLWLHWLLAQLTMQSTTHDTSVTCGALWEVHWAWCQSAPQAMRRRDISRPCAALRIPILGFQSLLVLPKRCSPPRRPIKKLSFGAHIRLLQGTFYSTQFESCVCDFLAADLISPLVCELACPLLLKTQVISLQTLWPLPWDW